MRLRRKIGRKYLHVSGRNDQFRARFVDDFLDPCLLVALGFLGDGKAMIRNVADVRNLLDVIGVVADCGDHIHLQFSKSEAIQQVAEAMVKF